MLDDIAQRACLAEGHGLVALDLSAHRLSDGLRNEPGLFIPELVILSCEEFPQPRDDIAQKKVHRVVGHQRWPYSPEVPQGLVARLVLGTWAAEKWVALEALLLCESVDGSLTLLRPAWVFHLFDARQYARSRPTRGGVAHDVKSAALRKVGVVRVMWGIVVSAFVSNTAENSKSARILAISPDGVHQLVTGGHVRFELNDEGAHDLRLFEASHGHASDARRERIELLRDGE